MRARPRTWPSIRFSRFITDVLAAVCIQHIYPHRVYAFSRVSSYGTVDPRKIFKQNYRTGTPTPGHHLYMPDASPDSAECTRQLPNLRYGTGTGERRGGDWSKPGIDRHDAALLDRHRARSPYRDPGDGGTFSRPEFSPLCVAANLDMASVSVCYAGRAVGRMALLRARLGIGAQPLTQYVQSDRARRRRCLSIQLGRH